MGNGGKNEVKEFTDMWASEARRRSGDVHDSVRAGRLDKPRGELFSVMTTKLGLIRTARWFVGSTQDFSGYTLFFVSQFDGTLEKYFDDFTLNGKDNLQAIWGKCVGCPTGPNVTARDLWRSSHAVRSKLWRLRRPAGLRVSRRFTRRLTGTRRRQKFQRAIATGGAKLEDKVNAVRQGAGRAVQARA